MFANVITKAREREARFVRAVFTFCTVAFVSADLNSVRVCFTEEETAAQFGFFSVYVH